LVQFVLAIFCKKQIDGEIILLIYDKIILT